MATGPVIQLPLTTLPLNTMTPYLRAQVEVSDGTLRWDSWWTALGFVPLRRARLTLPLANVSNTSVRVGAHWDRLVVGVGLLSSVLVGVRGWTAAVAVAAAGLLLVMAPTAQLRVMDTNGRKRRLSLCILHKVDVVLVAMALDDLTGRRVRRTRRGTRPPKPPA